MRISDWSSDVCSSDLRCRDKPASGPRRAAGPAQQLNLGGRTRRHVGAAPIGAGADDERSDGPSGDRVAAPGKSRGKLPAQPGIKQSGDRQASRSEEHTTELQSLMRISYDVFCWKKKK